MNPTVSGWLKIINHNHQQINIYQPIEKVIQIVELRLMNTLKQSLNNHKSGLILLNQIHNRKINKCMKKWRAILFQSLRFSIVKHHNSIFLKFLLKIPISKRLRPLSKTINNKIL